jgi:hypothetical protein
MTEMKERTEKGMREHDRKKKEINERKKRR